MCSRKAGFTASDDEALIDLVAGHQFLWDMCTEDFKNTLKKDLIWKEIGELLNKTGKNNLILNIFLLIILE